MLLDNKTEKQLNKLLETRELKLILLKEKMFNRSKERGPSAWSLNKAMDWMKFNIEKVKDEILSIKIKLWLIKN